MVIVGCLFAQYKLLDVEDTLVVAIVDKNVKWLGYAVELRIPLEISINF